MLQTTFLSSNINVTKLPPEILMSIFELGTYNSARDIDYLVELPPFEAIYADTRERQDKEALRTKHSLALTSSLFRKLSLRLLYEDIWIGRGCDALLNVLKGPITVYDECIDPGKLVKRVILPAMASGSVVEIVPLILSLCPGVRVLSRRSVSASGNRDNPSNDDSSQNGLSFTQLHRIDWINESFEDISTSNMSPRFVWHSSCLRVLSLNTDNVFVQGRELQPGEEREIVIDLPQLHTLCIRSSDVLGDPDEFWYSVRLPSLQRIILERPLALYALHAGCLAFYGTRIKTLELGRYPRFLHIDAISIALGYCPNVESLLFPVFTTMPPAKNHTDTPRTEWIEYHVKHIGLNASMEDNCDYQVSRTWMWVQLGDLIEALFGYGTRFAELERITLYGSEWQELIQEEAFESVIQKIRSHNTKIDCEDRVTGELVQRMGC